MILSKTAIIKGNSKNIKYYRELGFDILLNKELEIDVKYLSNGSTFIITVKCDNCDNIKDIQWGTYFKYVNGDISSKYYCVKCKNIKSKNTNLERYGVESPMQNRDILEKTKKTNLERWGTTCTLHSTKKKQEITDIFLDRYGVDSPLKSKDIQSKCKETLFKRYGVTIPLKSDVILDRLKIGNVEKYGVDNFSKTDEFRKDTKIANDPNYIRYISDSVSLFNCNDNHTYNIHKDVYHGRIRSNTYLCTVCNPVGDNKSFKEKLLFNFIEENYKSIIIQGYSFESNGIQIDIYLPELNLGFEFNGLYWHSSSKKDKNYHLTKTKYYQDRGIRIIHIWEDDWDYEQDIVKSQILNLLGKSLVKIYARKCIIKELESTTDFLNSNHIQGVDKSNIKLGLFYNDELVSVMTFNRLEGRKKMEDGGYNLSRFCNKINTNVIGGASKLLNYFIKNYGVTRIVSYADRDWSVGNLYITLGFNLVSKSKPDYKYVVDRKRRNKQGFKKSNLNINGLNITESEYMMNRGIDKIYDCGKFKFELKL